MLYFRLKVKNPTESFLSFNFNSSQKYDFVVREKESGFEIWRWSKGNFFTQVVHNQALLPEEEWEFKFFWDFKDNERNDIQKGEYFVSGILTTRDPRESEPTRAECAVGRIGRRFRRERRSRRWAFRLGGIGPICVHLSNLRPFSSPTPPPSSESPSLTDPIA